MYNSPISWSLRSVKVGDTVMYKDGHTYSKPKISKVARVTPFKDGMFVGKARVVKLEDETTWTGDGEKWGNASGYKSSYRVRAYHVVDLEAYKRQIEDELVQRTNRARRQAVLNEVALFADYATDEEIRTLRNMQIEMKKRQAMNAAVDYLRSIAGYPHNLELTP